MDAATRRTGAAAMTAAFSTSLAWARTGGELFEAEAARLDDGAVAAPSTLPGWTRGHVVTHVSRNADALVNLLNWARTGVETPMYRNAEHRNSDIERGAGRGAADQLADLRQTERRLADALADLPEAAWQATVRSARGREMPASEVPWMRVREVWIHAVDLGGGARFADFPAELVDALIDDAVPTFAARPDPPDVVLAPTDREREWSIGSGSGRRVAGTAADLLSWLLGRDAGDGLTADTADGRPPSLPPWL